MKIIDRVSKMAATPFASSKSATLREKADEARDQGRFREAAELYGAFLAQHPDSFDIWVQKGNCAKDCGEYRLARESYEAAIRLRPDDADVHLQVGHLCKLEGRLAEAGEAYTRSHDLRPTAETTFELRRLGLAGDGGALPAGKTHAVYFEMDDLFGYVKAHPTLSGIQRVQAGIARYLVHPEDELGFEPRFVIREFASERLVIRQIDPGKLLKLLDYMGSSNPSHDVIRQIVADIEGTSVAFPPQKGDIYFITGAFWGYGGVVANYGFLREAGVKLGVYIYDIIPVTHPEYCDASLSRDFLMSLGDGLAIFDFIFTISDFTASEVRRLQTKYGLRPVPVTAVPLAHSFGFDTDELPRPTAAPSRTIVDLQDRPYALYVSTIEGRKNHALVISSWQEMLKEGLDPPDLVFVGRHGWRVEGLFEILRQTDNLNGRVHILHDLSDVDLQQLYAHCLFTIFTSFVEGWGLPVGESLVAGRPCVASNNSSIPEVGGDFVDYCDPYRTSGPTTALLKRMCFDDEYRRSREEKIRTEFKARTWWDVGRDFVSAIGTVSRSGEPVAAVVPVLRESEFFHPSILVTTHIEESYVSNPVRLVLNETWYGAEDFGVWMRGRKGRLRFKTTLRPGTKVVVYLDIVPAPHSANCSVTMSVEGGQPTDVSSRTLGSKQVAVSRGVVGEDGLVGIQLHVIGRMPPLPNDARLFVMGVAAVAYAQADSLEARFSLLENHMFSGRGRKPWI